MLPRLCIAAFLAAALAGAQKYSGPLPAKPDLPYLKQAAMLIPLESAEARTDKTNHGTLFVIAGAASAVRTPLSLPIFILKVEKLAPDRLQLYKLEVKGGHREVLIGGANPPDILHMEVNKLSADGLCRIAVSDPLEAGEYLLSGEDSRQVFCFQVF
ncbi:conserved exported hypothetical protein [Candidatus Sulfopaludibacter sp. SbA3]|nr:conserved exported hypothetical protein [Candidatus Sulfopaludibacter sp. SbA3]